MEKHSANHTNKKDSPSAEFPFGGLIPLQSMLYQAIARAENLYVQQDENGIAPLTGIATYLDMLDRRTSGLQRGDLIVVAGSPMNGKTAMALAIAANIATNSNLPVAIFSRDMGGIQLATRLMGAVAEIDMHKMCSGNLSDEDFEPITFALGKLNDAPIYLGDSVKPSVQEICDHTRILYQQTGSLGLVVVDDMQWLRTSDATFRGERELELAGIMWSLKSLAKELDVPVIVTSQLRRNADLKYRPPFFMTDLLDPDGVEQFADLVLFIRRSILYERCTNETADCLDVHFIRNRNDPFYTSSIRLRFNGACARVENE